MLQVDKFLTNHFHMFVVSISVQKPYSRWTGYL